MQLRVIRRIESAVQSVTSCTAPQVQVGQVLASADHLNSSRASRRVVEFEEIRPGLPAGAVLAVSRSYTLLLGVAEKPEEVVPGTPYAGLVTTWEGGLVPTSLVKPVYDLARFLGLRPQEPSEELVFAHVLSPALAGWYYGRPVFWAARDWGDNAPVELEGEPAYQQGSLLVGWCGDDIPMAPSWSAWAGDPIRWLFNHLVVHENLTPAEREHYLSLPPGRAAATPVAVMYGGRPHAAVRFGGGRICSRDHEDIMVPAGSWVAIHPFPRRGGGVD